MKRKKGREEEERSGEGQLLGADPGRLGPGTWYDTADCPQSPFLPSVVLLEQYSYSLEEWQKSPPPKPLGPHFLETGPEWFLCAGNTRWSSREGSQVCDYSICSYLPITRDLMTPCVLPVITIGSV